MFSPQQIKRFFLRTRSLLFEVAGNAGEQCELIEQTVAAKMIKRLQYDGFRVLDRLLRAYFKKCRGVLKTAEHQEILLRKSACVSNGRATKVTYRVNSGLVDFKIEGWRVIHSAVPSESFYGSSEGRYNTVNAFREMQKKKINTETTIVQKIFHCVKEKELMFLRVSLGWLENESFLWHQKSCLKRAYDSKKELLFI